MTAKYKITMILTACILTGQIEVFTWSASGNIITEALAAKYPTTVVYVMDTVRLTLSYLLVAEQLQNCSEFL